MLIANNNLKGFEDRAHRVSYAYDNTQRQYDEHPSNDDKVTHRRRHQRVDAYLLLHGWVCPPGLSQ